MACFCKVAFVFSPKGCTSKFPSVCYTDGNLIRFSDRPIIGPSYQITEKVLANNSDQSIYLVLTKYNKQKLWLNNSQKVMFFIKSNMIGLVSCHFSSYLHCKWATLKELEKDPRIHQKIKRFRTKQAQTKHLFTEVFSTTLWVHQY